MRTSNYDDFGRCHCRWGEVLEAGDCGFFLYAGQGCGEDGKVEEEAAEEEVVVEEEEEESNSIAAAASTC